MSVATARSTPTPTPAPSNTFAGNIQQHQYLTIMMDVGTSRGPINHVPQQRRISTARFVGEGRRLDYSKPPHGGGRVLRRYFPLESMCLLVCLTVSLLILPLILPPLPPPPSMLLLLPICILVLLMFLAFMPSGVRDTTYTTYM